MHQSSCYPNVKKGKPHKLKNPKCVLLPGSQPFRLLAGGSWIPWVGEMEIKALPPNPDSYWLLEGSLPVGQVASMSPPLPDATLSP